MCERRHKGFDLVAEYHVFWADLNIILCLCFSDLFYCSEHVEKAWVDMQRFKELKDKDLREALINYAVMQISMCKKVQNSTWPYLNEFDHFKFVRTFFLEVHGLSIFFSLSLQGIQVWSNAKECFLKM